jgi:hypothetical protein
MRGIPASVALAALLAGPAATEAVPPPSMVGGPAPVFRLKGLDGKSYALSDFKGKFLVLHFGASW